MSLEMAATKKEASIDPAKAMAEWSTKKPATKRAQTITNVRMETLTLEVRDMVKHGDWSDAKPEHFVALYAWLHMSVYGVEATDMGPADRMKAKFMAGKMRDEFFKNNNGEFAMFLRWVWRRERGREEWRRENKRSGSRITWFVQFSGKLIADYRIDKARQS